MHPLSGSPTPLGATFDGEGVNFALASEHATAVHLCLFDAATDVVEAMAIPLTQRTGDVWHGYLRGLSPGQLYGYRVFGPWNPQRGQRFNPAKVVFDPYARLVGRPARVDDRLLGHAPGTDGDGPFDPVDSAASAPLAAVHHSSFDWGPDAPMRTPWSRTVIYEAHVKGFTARHPGVTERDRGTFAGLASPAAIAHLRRLGVTAVQLLPIHAHADEPALVRRSLANYWGYNTLGFFAPDPRFVPPDATLDAVDAFKRMVRALHAAGLEVILDVVYNHTAEGDHLGPTLSFRGIDNMRSYRLEPDRPARYEDWTGCGNTFDLRSLPVLQLVLDSLRYWVEDMHVDGFRFDLTSALTRGARDVVGQSPFLRAISEDPVLSRVKLIAEPWDATPGGYQLGGFPAEWSEWNDRYRDDVRRFWRGDPGMVDDLTTRLAGSRDLFGHAGRSPRASINFVTAHDGFTLADLVSYNEKHNEANGEQNRDGTHDNASWNGGAEGRTDDTVINALRARRRRNLMLTLAVSQGVPMLNGGDEMSRTQLGNNNAYCHDGPLTWTPWDLTDEDREFFEFVCRVMALRRAQPALRRDTFLDGRNGHGIDVVWLRGDGDEMNADGWRDRERRAIGMLLNGDPATGGPGGDTLLVVFNAASAPTSFLPPPDAAWEIVIDTTDPSLPMLPVPEGLAFPMAEYSAVVLRKTSGF